MHLRLEPGCIIEAADFDADVIRKTVGLQNDGAATIGAKLSRDFATGVGDDIVLTEFTFDTDSGSRQVDFDRERPAGLPLAVDAVTIKRVLGIALTEITYGATKASAAE
jgi:hypothetical protein